jgi:ubiquinone/menaquinone biosynthesis C-methylase UbiE
MSGLRERRGIDVNLRSSAQMREYQELARAIAAQDPGRLLDWGCGWGQVTKLLLDAGVDAHPFDYRSDEPAPGRASLERYPEITCTFSPEPVALPFGDADFDTALSCGVLEHVQDPAASLRELARVLRPGGRLIVVKLPNRHSYLEWVAKQIGLYHHGALPHDTIYTRQAAEEIVRANGFEVTGSRLANMLPLTIDHPLFNRISPLVWTANRVLERIPLLNRLATNVEVQAIRS